MTIDLLAKLQALPESSLTRVPLASLLALEQQRRNDPSWSRRRRDEKLADLRRALKCFALVMLAGLALMAMPHVVPGLVASISMFVASHLGALCSVAAIGILSGLAVLQSWSELPEKWNDALLCACLLAGSVPGGLLLVAATDLLVSLSGVA